MSKLICVVTCVLLALAPIAVQAGVTNPDGFEGYAPTTNWAPTAANEGWLVNPTYGATTFSIGNAYGLTGQGVASSTDYAMGELRWTESVSKVATPSQTFSADFYLGDPYGGDQRLLLSQQTAGLDMNYYLTLRNRGGVGQCFIDAGTTVRLPGETVLALYTWMHVDVQTDWTNNLVRARIGVVGNAMQDWSAWDPMYTGVQYAQVRFVTGEGEVRLDNVAITPEPGSLLAMGTGLFGLVGFAIRRRK